MKIAGIICEYNPFHNGHAYHIAETKKQLRADGVVCVMSGNFVQRGDIAVFPMEIRANAALKGGADLILEIPPRFVLQSAQFYAYNAVYILNALGNVNYLSFGSECGDIDSLKNALKETDKKIFRERLNMGMGYAAAMANSEILRTPNNILGAEYIKALDMLDSSIIPFTVKRNSVAHDSEETKDSFASATHIRKIIKEGGDFSSYVPDFSAYTEAESGFSEKLWDLISYRLKLGRSDDFEGIMNISEGLNNRILKFSDCKTLSECVDNVSCKRYPKSRVRRALFSIMLELEKSSLPPSYIRVLAVNETGRKILAKARTTAKIPILSRITKKDVYNVRFLKEELISNSILRSYFSN